MSQFTSLEHLHHTKFRCRGDRDALDFTLSAGCKISKVL
uniref:Uncharacterized protein n=1 Tax=Anguilla anguilla TaxID=7936 RepID=A0A0E9PS04_ANGAN